MKNRKKAAAAAACAAAAAAIYCSCAVERSTWKVRAVRLPAAFDGLRITVLSDVHGASFGPENRRLLEAVEASKPDYIAICGDLTDEASDPARVEPLIRRLVAAAPVLFVPGNHEWALQQPEALFEQLRQLGVRVLRNDFLTLERAGQTLVLAGADDPRSQAAPESPGALLERIRTRVPGDPYVVLLCHRNNLLALWSSLGADLVLAGHGHGGVIRLPLVGGLLSVDRTFFPKDAEGLYTRGRTVLAVSRGLGGVRLWNRPHLPTVVLKSAEEP